MPFSVPLAVGITNSQWVEVFKAHVNFAFSQRLIDNETYSTAVKGLDSLSSGIPAPSFVDFKVRAIKVVPAKVGDILSSIPEKPAFNFVRTLVIRDNNATTLRSYYGSRDKIKNIAIKYKDIVQKLDGEVTTVGYQFAKFYSNLKEILERLINARKYVEVINSETSLNAFAEGYSVEKLDFIAKELFLFNVSTFSSSNQNWFVSGMKDLADLSKGIIRYMKQLIAKGQWDADSSQISQLESSANSVISYSIQKFEIDFDTYSALFTQMHNAFSGVIKMIETPKIHSDLIEKEVAGVDKGVIISVVNKLFERIFDGERKREVFDQIFFEAPEVDNMIFRLAQQINNEYRNETKPVCCVGFSEGCMILIGKIFPLLNFACHLVSYKLSFYGIETVGDASKEVEIDFDTAKYDGKRVIIFDDILDRGITVKKFLEQARKKTKAVDFKVCMLFAKPNPENVYGDADYLGHMLPNVWVVGYGFDTLFKHRNADAVGSIKESFKSE